MWLQVIVDLIDILKTILEKLGLYSAPTTAQEEE